MRKNVLVLICFIAVLLLTGCQNKQQNNSSGASQEEKITSTSSSEENLEEMMENMDTADMLAMLVDLKIPEDEQNHNKKKTASTKRTDVTSSNKTDSTSSSGLSVNTEKTETKPTTEIEMDSPQRVEQENKTNNYSTERDTAPDKTTRQVVRGNSDSKIYHVYGQRDYENMANSKYLVEFNTEQEAQAAGYRRAKR